MSKQLVQIQYGQEENNLLDVCVTNAYKDAKDNQIDTTYATKEENELSKTTDIISGNNPNVNNSINAPLIYGKIKGYTLQDGEPTPDNPIDIQGLGDSGSVEVKTCGKNLLNAELNITIGSNRGYSIDVKPSTSYTLKLSQKCVTYNDANPSAQHWYKMVDEDNNILSQGAICFMTFSKVDEILRRIQTIKTTEQTKRIYIDLGTYLLNSPLRIQTVEAQLEEGTVATSYEPYTETTATIPIDTLYEGDYLEVYADGSGKIVSNNSVFTPTNVTLMYHDSSWADGMFRCEQTPSDIKAYSNTSDTTVITSTHFPNTKISDMLSNVVSNGVSILNKTIFFKHESIMTSDDLKTWFGENTVKVIYPLATPIETPLTAEQVQAFKQLYTFDNVTNFFCDGEITARYYVNTDSGDTVGMLQGMIPDIEAGENVVIEKNDNKITISSTDTKYTHPTTSGNKHIPSGGSSGQILRWAADGTAVWGADNSATKAEVSTLNEVLTSRMDSFTKLEEGSTTGDAELVDARIDYKGTTYENVGAHIREATSQLSNEIDYLNSGNYIKKINLEPDLIGWVNNNGTFMSDEEFYTSKPFEIQKGQTIKLVASGFSDNVSMISFYEGKNLSGTNVYTPLVISDGMPAKEYTYKAEMDMRIVVSYRIADTHSCEIVSNIKQLSSLLEQSNIVKNVDLEANFDIAYIHNNGEYFDSTRLTEYNTLHPFEIKKGQTIVLVGGGFDKNVSMISKYNGDNSYTPLVISDCNGWEVKEYIYTAEETMDIVVSYNNSYYRKCYIITDVYNITSSENNAETTTNYLAMFHTIGGVGDSLMSGAVNGELNGTCEDRYEYSWLSCICRKNGLTANHYSMGGLTTKTWFDWRKDQLIADAGKNSLFYIALGTNDVYQNYEFGSATDEAGTDTFCGKYKEIIELVHEKNPHAPIFCVSTYGITYNFGTCANYIREISEQYNYCYYVDLLNNLPTELLRNAAINSVMQQNGHYTGYGYIQIANIIEKLSNEIIQNRMNDFIYLPFYNEQ